MINYDFNKKCYGCSACKNICPKKAITMVDDKDGFLIPKIDKEKCIDCGLCEKVCPRISNINKVVEEPLKCMYIYKKNQDEVLKKSTSSGIAYELSKNIITNGGYVCGCVWDNMIAKHIITNDINMLEKIQGTKYVQSDIQYIYKDIEKYLKDDKKVLFIGMACQIAGLKKYLKKDYNNIYYVQIICHGVSSPKVFEKYKKHIENKYKKELININFRYKGKGGWLTPNSMYYFKDGSKVKLTSDAYFVGFGRGLYDRNSCSYCEMKNNFDIADIIIGDAWGIDSKSFKQSKNKGASSIIINSEKGAELFDNVKDLFIVKKVNLNEISKENPAIIRAYKANKDRDLFINKILNNNDFPEKEILGKRHKLKGYLSKIGLLSTMKKVRYISKHK